MELNRKDYRKYVSSNCNKCVFHTKDKNNHHVCRLLNSPMGTVWDCIENDTLYIFKLIKK